VTYHWIVNKNNTTDTTSGAGTVYPSGAPDFTIGVRVFHLQLLTAPLVSSNISYFENI